MGSFNRLAARWLTGFSALGAIVPFAAQAQEAPALVPVFSIYANTPRSVELLRTVLPMSQMRDWMTAADFPAAELMARSKGEVVLRVAVGADGKVTGCTVIEASAPVALQQLACTIVSTRGKFRHALSRAGTPVASDAKVHFNFDVIDTSRPMVPPPPPAPPPAPPPPGSNAPSPKLKPLRAPDWARFAPPGQPSGEIALTLVSYSYPGRPETRRCYVSQGSGDPVLDKASCAAVEAGDYARPEGVARAELQMLVRWKRGKATFELPSRERPTSMTLTGGYAATRIAFPPGMVTQSGYAHVTFNPDGSVLCIIGMSTGSDTADVAICEHFRTKVKFTPAIDVFGRRVPAVRGFYYDK